jgi:RNA polymerase sigma-B factor
MALGAAPDAIRLRRCDDHALFERYGRTRDPADKEALVERFQALALHLSRKYHARGEREDLEQIACLALLKAIDRYDPSRGIAFSSFAMPTILGELKRYFRDRGWAVRVPRSLQELQARVDEAAEEMLGELGRYPTAEELAERCETTAEAVLEARGLMTAHRPESLDRPAGDDGTESLGGVIGTDDPGFVEAERAADLDRLFSALTPREREILRLRFDEDLVQRDIAERLGLSQMHVSRLIRQAIEKLQAAADRQTAPGGTG